MIRVNTFDLLYLNGSMQHKELLLIAERKRSVRAARKKQSNKDNHGSWFVSWLRGRLFERHQTEKTPRSKIANQSLPNLDEISGPWVDTSDELLG